MNPDRRKFFAAAVTAIAGGAVVHGKVEGSVDKDKVMEEAYGKMQKFAEQTEKRVQEEYEGAFDLLEKIKKLGSIRNDSLKDILFIDYFNGVCDYLNPPKDFDPDAKDEPKFLRECEEDMEIAEVAADDFRRTVAGAYGNVVYKNFHCKPDGAIRDPSWENICPPFKKVNEDKYFITDCWD